MIGLVPFSLSVIFNNLAKVEGRAKIDMISMIIGAGVNIILFPIFIYDWIFDMGVKGADIATIIAKIASFIYIFAASFFNNSNLNIKLKKLHQVNMKMVG